MFTVARLRFDKRRIIRGRGLSLSHLVAVNAVGMVVMVCVVGLVLMSVVSIRVVLAEAIDFGFFFSRRELSLPGSVKCFVTGSTR